MVSAVVPAGRHHPAVLVVEVTLLRLRVGVLVPRMTPIDRIAERIARDEHRLAFPVVVVRAAEEDADAEVDLHQVVGDELTVDHHARCDTHRPAPLGHVAVVEVAHRWVLERSPAAEQDAPPADLLVPGHRLVEEVEQIVVHRHDALHELHVAHQARVVVREQLDRRSRPYTAGIQGRRMDVTPLHQAEHLPRPPADLEGLAVELTGERVERTHDVADGAVTMVAGVRCLGVVRPVEDSRVRLGDHLLAEVDPDQVLLEDVVVEHVLGGLAEVDDLLTERRWMNAVRHVLRVARARGVVVAADAADAAGDEVGVARVFALHEHAVAAEDRRRAVAFGHRALAEVDLGVDAETSDDARDRVPCHLDEAIGVRCLGATVTSTCSCVR